MKNGFVKLAAATPEVSVGAPMKNAEEICRLIDKAYENGTAVLTFPELCVTGYTCGDLFFSEALISSTIKALEKIAEHTKGKKMLVFVGAPIRANCKLYNCAVAIDDGEIIGITPKRNLPNYADAYEARWFTPAGASSVRIGDNWYGVDTENRLYYCDEIPTLVVGCEICEDFWVPECPSIGLSKAGATVICNLSASLEVIGKEEYRRTLVKSAGGREISAYVYANCGMSESTTDGVFSGHTMIGFGGKIVAENKPFCGEELIYALVDTEHLIHDRMRKNTYPSSCPQYGYSFSVEEREYDLTGEINDHPFLPKDPAEKKERCARILDMQAYGLAKRITAAHANGCIVALSGGLDSTLALIVAARAMDILGRDHKDILSVTMPCFGTTTRTRSNAESMAVEFGTSFRCIDIKEAVDIHFRDIGHDKDDLSVVYENSQARERTQIIMDIANADNSLVVGTGDLSELALGWATYNGDHMSNYGVNAGVPKTLIRHVVSYYADECEACGKTALAAVLRDVLATPVSPELLPAKDGEISQKTEDIVGPYDLHDFFLYRFIRWGEAPEKIYRVAKAAFKGQFDDETILKWLNTFMRRFYTQQFKRSALPDGVKIGSVGLSPRSDWKMPSDACGDEMKITK